MSEALQLRVMVADAWDTISIAPPADTPLAAVKAAALTAARITIAPGLYEVKFRGAEVRDESATLADLAIPHDANLIVLRRARRPAR